MEVLDPTNIFPDAALLASIADSINAGDGMNAEKDIEVALLEMVSPVYILQSGHFPHASKYFYILCLIKSNF